MFPMKQFYGPQNEILLTTSFDMDRVMVFVPGISGKAHSSRFAWLDTVADEAGYASARVHLWEDETAVKTMTILDIHKRLRWVCEELQNQGYVDIVLVGKSFGGGAALTFTDELITKKILWAPAFSYAGEVGNIAELQSVTLAEMTQVTDITVGNDELLVTTQPVCIIHGTDDSVIALENSVQIVAALPQGELVHIAGADHSFKTPEAEAALVAATAEALKS